jgi:hypothetical protein
MRPGIALALAAAVALAAVHSRTADGPRLAAGTAATGGAALSGRGWRGASRVGVLDGCERQDAHRASQSYSRSRNSRKAKS